MQKIEVDQWEFDCVSAEESLVIWLWRKRPIPDVQFGSLEAFVAATTDGIDVPELLAGEPFSNYDGYGLIRPYLSRFAGIEVPNPCTWPTYILAQDYGDWDGVFDTPTHYIRYWWSTSA